METQLTVARAPLARPDAVTRLAPRQVYDENLQNDSLLGCARLRVGDLYGAAGAEVPAAGQAPQKGSAISAFSRACGVFQEVLKSVHGCL